MENEQRSSKGRFWRTVIVLGILGVAAWSGRDHLQPLLANVFPEKPAAGPTAAQSGGTKKSAPVLVQKVSQQADDVVVQAIGTARAVRSVTLYPDADGEIVEFPVRADDTVKENDIILRLNSRNGALAVQVAETRVKEAESALARAEKLRKSNVQSAANVDDAWIVLERAKLELRQAQVALADRSLRAPFPGIVGIPNVEIGDRVTTSTEIATLDDRTTLIVEFEVAEQYLSRLSYDAPVVARTAAFANRPIDGRVDRIDSRVDPVSRTVLVRAAFDNKADELRPGMSFFVSLTLSGPMLAAVPELALQWENGSSYVWRVTNGVVERIDVKTRRRLNNLVLIEGDLQPGDDVVIEGVQRLRPGIAVSVSNSAGA